MKRHLMCANGWVRGMIVGDRTLPRISSGEPRFLGEAGRPLSFYVVNDNEEHSFIEAMDCATGETVWKVDRNERSNWSTPFVWENQQRTEIITPGSGKVRSYDLSGSLLWEPLDTQCLDHPDRPGSLQDRRSTDDRVTPTVHV